MSSTFLSTLQSFMTLEGRSGRLRYFVYSGLVMMLYFMAVILYAVLLQSLVATGSAGAIMIAAVFFGVFLAIMGLIIMWMNVCISVQRLHDLNLSGWYYIGIITLGVLGQSLAHTPFGQIFSIIGLLINLYLLFAPGTKGDNNYGPQLP